MCNKYQLAQGTFYSFSFISSLLLNLIEPLSSGFQIIRQPFLPVFILDSGQSQPGLEFEGERRHCTDMGRWMDLRGKRIITVYFEHSIRNASLKCMHVWA